MVRRTFASCKAEIARICGATGMSTADPRVLNYLNDATEELMNTFDSPAVVDRIMFNVTSGRITLPSSYDRIMLMNLNCVPMQMQSPWYEFIGWGLDYVTEGSDATQINYLQQLQGVIDKEEVAAFNEVPTDDTYRIRIYGTVDELDADDERPVINVQGYDVNGRWIRTEYEGAWIDGINVEINGDTAPYWVDTDQTFKSVTAISKPVTKGYVYLYAAGEQGSLVHIGTYAPKDTQPSYRRYFVRGLNLPNTDSSYQVLARCRRRFVPITADGDYLIISNLPAIKAMIQAVYYREANKTQDYLSFRQIAIGLLKEEAKAYIGLQTQKPFLTVREGTAVRMDGAYIL